MGTKFHLPASQVEFEHLEYDKGLDHVSLFQMERRVCTVQISPGTRKSPKKR